jgi:hypothetical protein
MRCVALLVLACFLSVTAYAESGDFYKKDFAINPLGKEAHSRPKVNKDKGSKEASEQKPANPDWSFEGDMLYPPKGGDKGTPAELTDLDAPKVQSIGVIVDVNTPEHFQSVADALVEMSDANDIVLGTVWALSATAIYMHPAYNKLHARGMIHNTVEKLPEKYSQVKNSPTYIIETEQGEILLEGVTKLDRYINSNGQFIEKGMSLAEEIEPVKAEKF